MPGPLRQPVPLEPARKAELDEYLAVAARGSAQPPGALAHYLREKADDGFRAVLFEQIRNKKADEVEVYTAAGVSKSLFSRIRSDAAYRPSKRVVLSLAFALGLRLDAAERLLHAAGHALARSDTADLIARYYFENGPRDLNAVNDALYTYGQPLLAGVCE